MQNVRLKRLVTDRALDIDTLKEAKGGNTESRIAAEAGIEQLMTTFSVSQRRTCVVVSRPRST